MIENVYVMYPPTSSIYELVASYTYAGRNLIMISPLPVAAAPPAPFIAYEPAPIIGESPTRLQKLC